MRRWQRIVVTMTLGTLVVAGVAAVVTFYDPAQQTRPTGRFRGPPPDRPVPVLAAVAHTADVPVYLDGVGTVRALNTVTVRPQVEGKLISVSFQEGQEVAKGDVLARIDPTTYQAQLDQALARKAQNEALLANARRDLDRYVRLAATNAATQQQADTQRAQVAQLEAQVRLDQAAIDNARAVLGYTTIQAPISGRTGIRLVDEGNIVRPSDATGIVVITQIRPIAVLFNVPQQRLAELHAAFAEGALPVEVLGPDQRTPIEQGRLTVIDNQVDQATGTVRLKAEFANERMQLWPGQFVTVRLKLETLRGVVVVPTAAVQRGPDGPFVYVIQPRGTVRMQPVAVTRQDDQEAVIGRGLAAGEHVVTTGFAQLTDGRAVQVFDGSAPPAGTPPGGAPRPAADARRDGRLEAFRRGEGLTGRGGSESRPRDGPRPRREPAP